MQWHVTENSSLQENKTRGEKDQKDSQICERLTPVYAVRAIERVPAGSCHFSCLTDPSQSVVNFPCVWK